MDPHDILKEARRFEESGDGCYEKGQLPEAQRYYSEVLAMLKKEITSTDQRKEKETLLLEGHLKLAKCALHLGDDSRVVYHCNIALSMDSTNAKAHFTKARAFENSGELSKALEGYQYVLTLEPDNEIVQEQLRGCQMKLDITSRLSKPAIHTSSYEIMDPLDVVENGRTIAERGNYCYKIGQLTEAQRDYTEVLAMLSEITFTGDNQRKEKETLILTAHLNLADFALQLRDDAKAIYHCNVILGMDNNNVEALCRKARAFENRAEFAKALESYQHVLILEPDNEIAQKQLNGCQEKTRRRSYYDTEHVYERQVRYRCCEKYPGHKNFYGVNEFMEHLPPQYQDDRELIDHVQNQTAITVLLKVRSASENRPWCFPGTQIKYPFANKYYRKVIRFGSGWFGPVSKYYSEQECPCPECKKSESPHKGWAKVSIHTSTHLVFDTIEGNNTECFFFYDTENDLKSCPKLRIAVKVESSVNEDSSVLTFISHDQDFLNRLRKTFETYSACICSLKQRYNISVPNSPKQITPAQLRERLSKLMTEQKNIMLEKHEQFSPLLLMSIRNNRRTALDIYDATTFSEEVETTLPEDPLVKRAFQEQHNFNQLTTERFEREISYINELGANSNPIPDVEPYNKDHPLTIIVSHPHGCSKKITIGEVTERKFLGNEQFSKYTYNTPTCQGSSGALVFILGQGLGPANHPHSATFDDHRNKSESGFSYD